MPDTESMRNASEGMPCELISWDRFHRLSLQLAHTILTSGYRPSLIVAIERGGYMPARVLADYLHIFDMDGIKIEHYQGVHRQKLPRIRYPLSAAVTGHRVLLVDDVTDSGDTFHTACQHLHEHGQPTELKTAVLHHKHVSGFVPDFYVEEITAWRWIIYPWAVIEDLTSFLREMRPPPDDIKAFASYLDHRHGIRVTQQILENVLRASERIPARNEGIPRHAC